MDEDVLQFIERKLETADPVAAAAVAVAALYRLGELGEVAGVRFVELCGAYDGSEFATTLQSGRALVASETLQ